MSHINIKTPNIPMGKNSILNCGSFDRGVAFCKYSRELSDGQSPYMKNLIYSGNMLRTRFGQCSCNVSQQPKGDVHSMSSEQFFGKYIFHIGTGLYSFDGTNLVLLSQELPDCSSFIFEMNSKIYVFCSEVRIFTVDSSFTASEHIIPTVKVAYDANYTFTEYTPVDTSDNLIMFRISVDYRERSSGISYLKLPCECDPNYPVIFTDIKTGVVYPANFVINGDTLEFKKDFYLSHNISFVPKKGTVYANYDKIFGCTRTCTYGGTTSGGTRVFFTGNKDYPGYYFHSELLSPLKVKKLSYDIIGNGSENVNCLAKQKSDLIAFCDRSVYRISYIFDSDTGPDFIVSEISTRIGCDIPGSVRLIDNRLVFADSSSGIHIIVSSEYTDELSIRSISANINGNGTGMGFMNEARENLDKCVSIDFDRKYMLVCPSGNAYVWDYGNSPYVPGDNPLASEKRLSWYFFDSIYENTLFELSGRLYGTVNNGGDVEFVYFSEQEKTDFGMDIQTIYNSCDFDMDNSFAKKVPTELYLNASGNDRASVVVCIMCDGNPISYEYYTFTERDEQGEKLRRLMFKIPGYETYRVSFSLIGISGRIGLYDAAVKFRSKGIYYR